MAIYGIRVWDSETKNLILDISDRITRIIDSFTIPKTVTVGDKGTITNSVFSRNYFLNVKNNVSDGTSTVSGWGFMIQAKRIKFSVDGSTLTWEILNELRNSNIKEDIVVFYGEY